MTTEAGAATITASASALVASVATEEEEEETTWRKRPKRNHPDHSPPASSSSSSSAFSAFFFYVLLLPLLLMLLRPTLAELPDTFGGFAHQFTPLPDTVVGAHCRWELRLDTVPNRVPSTVTEVVCHRPDETCGGNANYRCRQIRAKMVVAYHSEAGGGRGGHHLEIVQRQNRTFSVGCSCVLTEPTALEGYGAPPIEKRRFTPAKKKRRTNVED